MIQLRVLMLCLLVSCNLFSQTDTLKKVVLSEEIARAVIKDLLKGDICQERLLLKEEEIKNLTEQNEALVEIIKTKGEKEDVKDDIISIQDKALGWFSKPKLHGYLGVQSLSFTDLNIIPYGKVNLEFKKLNVGALLYVSDNPNLKYGLILEYKVF